MDRYRHLTDGLQSDGEAAQKGLRTWHCADRIDATVDSHISDLPRVLCAAQRDNHPVLELEGRILIDKVIAVSLKTPNSSPRIASSRHTQAKNYPCFSVSRCF
jgi:hypothetical protein